MAKKSTSRVSTDWDEYVHKHGLTDLGHGEQSRAFSSGDVVVKVPRRRFIRYWLGEEKLWRRVHKESSSRLGDLAVPFEYIEKALTCTFRRKFVGIIPYSKAEIHPAYVVQAHTGGEPTLLQRMNNGAESFNQGLADLIALSKACLTRGAYLHDMDPDNFVYWKGGLRIRDIGAVVTNVEHTRRLIMLKSKLFDPNLALALAHQSDGAHEFSSHMTSYRSLESVDVMQRHLNKGKPVSKVTLL